ncbi:MAG TPA: hypothetical protein VH540_11205 [Ktedonobacterales bacterium]|jgi:small ligand-binding sensory domain FIST
MVSRRQLFRTQALQEYAQSREKDILPRLVRPPVQASCWLLLGLLFVATLLAWQSQVAVSVAAAGIIVPQSQAASAETAQATAIIFVPASSSLSIPVGQSLSVQLTGQPAPLGATIRRVESGVITPEAARQQYMLTGDLAWVITQPSVVVTLALNTDVPATTLVGRSLSAQIRVGSRSLLSLLPDLFTTLW